MPGKRILILGGTSDARILAAELLAAGYEPVSSLAGMTQAPVLPAGEVRVGGFGGEEGLYTYLKGGNFAAVADATHPFAVQISQHGFAAAKRVGVPYLRLERQAWVPSSGDTWEPVADIRAAAACLPTGARIMLTIGRKEIAPFLARDDLSGVVRMIERNTLVMPAPWHLILARPPFNLEDETRMMISHGITHLVTKNAGGTQTEAKLQAARTLGVPVIMIERPAKHKAPTFASATSLVAAL
ncbi:MAG: cobalt-precorrin-6A reductase [Aestuariivirga sp.]